MNNRNSKIICTVSFVGAFFALIACGDSKTTETIVEKGATDIVASVADLPKCTAQNEGEQIFVKEDGLIRFCSDGKWYAVAGGENASCSTEALKDSSGVKIICNGDSVGVVLNGKDGSVAAGCTVETLADDSGIKVICGGDSVGVVLNGKDGEQGIQGEKGEQGIQGEKGEPGKDGVDGKDGVAGEGSASSCALVTKDCIVHVACDKDTVSLDVISKEEACNEIAILDSEKVSISLDSVKGASQKGPFLSGSKVLVKELEDGRSLTQTGNNFDGKILNDKGEFKITARMLVSQYVMLEATGYYRNEVTGENSSSPLTLFGITDVTTRNIVNINLLTHLEYERVIYLVTKKKMKVLEAKKQAQQEIFDILHIDNSNFSNSEDLNIAGSSDEDGALLAFSILFQGDRSVSQLTELLTRVSTDMEKDGAWEDAATKTDIADWAMAADTSGRLDSIRKYVADWKLGSMVPKFEPYIRNFWRVEHGLGLCGDTVKVGTVVKPTQGKVKADVRFICVESDDGEARWRVATDFEKDTYGWNAGTDGDKKSGSVTSSVYVYDADGIQTADKKAGWRRAIGPEEEFGGCRAELIGNIVTYRGAKEAGFYQCQEKSHKWVKILSTLTIDTQKWEPETDGYAAWGDSVGVIDKVGTDIAWKKVCYVYDESLSPAAYRVGNETDCTLGLMGCTKKQAGRFVETADDGNSYSCADEKWNQITDPVLRNTRTLACKDSNNAEMIHGTKDDMYFVCTDGKWEKASTDAEIVCRNDGLCKACFASTEGEFTVYEKVVYGCASKAWIRTTLPASVETARCVEDNLDSTIFDLDTLAINSGIANTADWICSSTGWHRARDWRDYTDSTWQKKMRMVYGYDTSATSTTYFKDERDGQWYRKVTIGTQVWMAENLRYADSTKYVNLRGQTWCNSRDGDGKCVKAGRYYSWTAAMDFNSQWQNTSATALIKTPYHQGICPEGWHIPTEDEWSAMASKSGGYAAQQAIGNVGWPNATNASGFTALPAGYYIGGSFNNVGSRALFWSATEYSASDTYRWYMDASDAYLGDYSKYNGYSVRCLQDTPAELD
ncbi:FISUMP domain-containing protein [uncultured Fibrobacter sp.]|uniref:FISUMP domain-containing protein n=1 Tax=uncultured Fibrobacter sp. TaxID=261512 RepID=UPI0025CE06A7|nr:FISUMP domain-containing protein [uncultured Fibrobacter sp.]